MAWSAICHGAVAVAVFGFGAPPLILLPVNVIGVTIYATMTARAAPPQSGES